jgi:L,D-transpeptidase-like protein
LSGRYRPRPRLLAAAVPLAVIALLPFGSASGEERSEAAEAPLPAVFIPWPGRLHATAYERADLRGQPIVLLDRATPAHAEPGGRRIAMFSRLTEFGKPRWLAVVGERRRWLRVIATELPNGRTAWIHTRRARIEASPWAVRADISRRSLEVLKDGRVLRGFTVGIGAPASPTPPGRFGVTDKLRFGRGSLAYGCCVLGLTGHLKHPGNGSRMAIHGTSAAATIGGAASFGCLRASGTDMRWLLRRVWIGSVVEIRN